MATEFKVGDLVRLKSSGPVMCVESIIPDSIAPEGCRSVGCVWFDGATRCDHGFAPATLAHIIASDVWEQPYSPPLPDAPVVMEGWPEEGTGLKTPT